MTIKLFGKGLGIFDHPFDVVAPADINSPGGETSFVRDTTDPRYLGSSDRPGVIRDLLDVPLSEQFETLHDTIQLPTKDVRKNTEIIPTKRPVVNLGIKPQLFSAESGPAPFETLFHDFEIESLPYYNFWTPDELTNDRDERGDRKLDDLPRYIKVMWKVAPDLLDPEERVRPREVNTRPMKPVMFGLEMERPKVFSNKGIGFTPEHLQTGGFEKIKGIIANGYLAPGVLEAIVDMPLHNTGVESHRAFAGSDSIDNVDEDAFLLNPQFTGLSVHELRAQVNQVTNGIANMASIAPDGVSSGLLKQKSALVDGKFMLRKSSSPGGKMQISSVHPSSPTLSFAARSAVPAKSNPEDGVMAMARVLSQPTNVASLKTSAQVKVKFFNPAVGGLLDPRKVNLMSSPEHVETLSAIAPSLSSLEVLSQTNLFYKDREVTLPSLPSPKVRPLEYIGYVLEKYRRQKSGVFVKVEEIDLPAREVDYYIDTKIVYGEVYRYRIKAVVRWTRPDNQGVMETSKTTVKRFGSHTVPVASYKSSYLVSEWSHTWAYGSCIDDQPPLPPDELTVRPESHKRRVVVTMKLPYNPQKDILKMRLFRKIQDENGRDMSDWMQITESDAADRKIDFAPQNVVYFDNDLDFFQKKKMKAVYAAQCISRHGEDSTLSEQLGARLNQDYFTKGEFPVEFVSSPGVRLEYFGAFSVSPPRTTRTEIVVSPAPTRVGKSPGVAALILAGRNTMGNMTVNKGDYVCRVQSLDTGETADIPFSSNFVNLQNRQTVSKFDFYVPSHSVSGKNSNDFDSESDTRLEDELTRFNDGGLPDASENDEVLVYDRASKGDRW